MLKLLLAFAMGLCAGGVVLACTTPSDPTLEVRRVVPWAERSTAHWPFEQEMIFGSVLSFLVPVDTVTKIEHIAKGTNEPLVEMGQDAFEKLNRPKRYIDGDVSIDFDAAKYKWVHLHASSFGTSQVVFKSSYGWSHSIRVGVVYAEKRKVRLPIQLEKLDANKVSSFIVSSAEPMIFVSVPGKVTDGWHLERGEKLGYTIERIEKIEVPFNDPERVSVLIGGVPESRAGTVVLTNRLPITPKDAFEFRVDVRMAIVLMC